MARPDLGRRRSVGVGIAVFVGSLAWPGCTTIDPGSNFVIRDQTFNASYFYCFVEPQVIFAKKCGSGDPAQGDAANGCHFNSSAVSGMALIQHPAIACSGGAPLDETSVGAGSPAQSNLQAVSLEMSTDYLNAPVIVRPTGHAHPRTIFASGDPVESIIATWATK